MQSEPSIFSARKSNFFGRGTCGAAWNSLFVLRKLLSLHHDFLIPWKKLHCGADRVVVPSGLRQYLSVCRRDFPIQGDVAPKAWNCSKTFMSKTIEGAHCSHTLGRTSIPFVIKVLEFLKPFSKGFKWVWAKPTTFQPTTFACVIFCACVCSSRKGVKWLISNKKSQKQR